MKTGPDTLVCLYSYCPLQGLSFLDLRYNLLLFYLQDLTHLISIKTEGGKIKDSAALSRVVTIRTVRVPFRGRTVSVQDGFSFSFLIRVFSFSEGTGENATSGPQTEVPD